MADQILSESLARNLDESKISRDPFVKAQSMYASKNGEVLSSSPMQSATKEQSSESLGDALGGNDINAILARLGISEKGLMYNQLGKIQLIGRLKEKFGDSYQNNPDAMEAIKAFDTFQAQSEGEPNKDFMQAISGAERTLGALFGSR